MNHLDDLPKRHTNHATESKAEAAFQNLLSNSEDFVLQASDRKDYGTDCQIEVIDHESATNVRIHVQLRNLPPVDHPNASDLTSNLAGPDHRFRVVDHPAATG